jgi:hypothetical protein
MIWRSGDPKANKCEGGTQLQSKPFYIKGFRRGQLGSFPMQTQCTYIMGLVPLLSLQLVC